MPRFNPERFRVLRRDNHDLWSFMLWNYRFNPRQFRIFWGKMRPPSPTRDPFRELSIRVLCSTEAMYESLDEVKEIIDAWGRRFFIFRCVITVYRLKLQMRNALDVDKRNLFADFSSTTFLRWSRVQQKIICEKYFYIVWIELDYFCENGVSFFFFFKCNEAKKLCT